MAEKIPVSIRRLPILFCLLALFPHSALLALLPVDQDKPPAAVEPEANSAAAAADRAEKLYDQEKYAAALPEFEKALAGGVRNGRLLYEAAYCQQVTGKPQDLFRTTMLEAVKALDEVVHGRGKTKARLQDHFYLQAAYAAVGDTGTAHRLSVHAIETYKKGEFGSLHELDPRDLLRLAQMAADAGDASLQLEALDRATPALSHGDQADRHRLAQALTQVGRLQLESGRLEAAVAAANQALEVNPKQPGARLILARTLFRQKNFMEAARQWYWVRQEDPARATEAVYIHQVMLTLAQNQLLDKKRPLEDLQRANRAQLEKKIEETASQFRQVAQLLPQDMVNRGYAGKKIDPETRTNLKKLRDLKYRLAWSVAWYTDRGLPIREFAFARGFQSALRVWRLLKKDQTVVSPGPLPDWLTDEERARYSAAGRKSAAAAGRKRKRHQARQKKQQEEAGKHPAKDRAPHP
ncbi:MAG: tetratricopeptide repeat protein [Acidobacteriota bacterium]